MRRPTRLILLIVLLITLATLSLWAQAPPEPAESLGTRDLEILAAAVPTEGVRGIALIQVGRLLSPALFEQLLGGVRRLAPTAPLDNAQSTYDEEIQPLAANIRACVAWMTDEPGLACVGSFGPDGFDPIAESLAECRAMGLGEELCGTSETDFPGHVVDYSMADRPMLRLDNRYFLLAPNPGAARSAMERLVGALDTESGVGPPALGGVALDPSAIGHGVAHLPEELSSEIASDLPFPVRIDVVSVRFGDMPAGLGIELRANCGTDAAALQVRDFLRSTAGMMLMAEPQAAQAFGSTPEELRQMLETAVIAQGTELVVTLEGEVFVGTLAAIAIPAFVRYVRLSRSAEAVMNVRRLYDGAATYYGADLVDATGSPLPRQFPAPVPLTPAQIPCGEPALPSPELWEAPTWQALNFALSDPHYYSYQFDSSGVGPAATFTASAFGDLDCDGVLSTFIRVGSVTPGGEVLGGAGLYQNNETE